MLRAIMADIAATKERDPAARSTLEILLCYSGLHAIVAHRVNHWWWTHGFKLWARFGSQLAKMVTGIEIHPGATIGRGFFIDHGTGTIIGETTEIGDDVTLFHGVTLGGTGKERGKRHPTVEDDVTIGAHAQILGSFTIGRGSVIGAGAVVVEAVPPNCTVVGQKAYIVRREGRRVYDFRHDRLPTVADPAIECLMARVEKLERDLAEAHRMARQEAGVGVGSPQPVSSEVAEASALPMTLLDAVSEPISTRAAVDRWLERKNNHPPV
jgi:serine O-acetyltransferase